MTNTPNQQPDVYRFSNAFIKRFKRTLIAILIIGIGGGIALMIYASATYGDPSADGVPTWIVPTVVALLVTGFALPLLLGAIIGGLVIHRFAWMPLLLVVLGLFATGATVIEGLQFLLIYGIIAMVIGTILTIFIAVRFTNVPVYFGLPTLNSPRVYLPNSDKAKLKNKK